MSNTVNDLINYRALICGGSEGIGLASAKALAERGADIILLARNEAKLQLALSSLGAGRHRYLCADLNQIEQCLGVLQAELGARGPIQILLNNSAGPAPGRISNAKPEQFVSTFAQHVLAAHQLSLLLLDGMRTSQFGRIVNIISTSVKEPLADLGVSNTVRGAMASWAKTLAGEVASDGITVNNVLPGYTKTARLDAIVANRMQKTGDSAEQVMAKMLAEVPMKRPAEPAEVAAAVAFLCSKSAAYITGINIPVDGGRTRSL